VLLKFGAHMNSFGLSSKLFVVAKDIQFGVRQLRRSPATSITLLVTLTLGIGATVAMFSLVNAWLLRPLPLKDPQQLVSVWRTSPSAPREPAYFNLYHDYLVWKAGNRSFQSLAATFEQDYALTGAGEAEQLHGAVATWNLFSTVGASAANGRLFLREDVDGGPACVISHSLWMAHFGGSANVIGRSITLNGKSYRVLGVLPQGFSLRVLDRPFETAVWTLIEANDPGHSPSSPAPVALIGRLRPGVTAAQAEADLGAMEQDLQRRFKGYPPGTGILVSGLQQDNTRTIRGSLLFLLGAVGVLLLIACVNAGSLIVGRNSHRAAEFAVRVSLGCSPARLLQQITLEVLALFVLAGVIGLGLAAALVRIFVTQNPFGVLPPGGIGIDGKTVAATALLVCATSLLFGSLPAFRALRTTATDALRTRTGTVGRAHLRSRMTFVGIEFALSVVLLAAAALLITTFTKINSEAPGFNTNNVLVADVSVPYRAYPTTAEQARLSRQVMSNLEAQAQVGKVGVALAWPFEINGLNPVEIEGSGVTALNQMPSAAFLNAGPGYFEALGISLLRGRTFTDDDQADKPAVAVINEELARKAFAGTDPIGRHIRLHYAGEKEPSEPWATIVGVVGATRSLRYNQVLWDRYPAVYTSMFQVNQEPRKTRFDAETMYFYIQEHGGIGEQAIAAAVHKVDMNLPVGSVRSTGTIVRELRAQPRLRARLLTGFTVFTLILAGIGVYGVMTQLVEQRRREIGIRMALGAIGTNIVVLVLRRALLVAGVGIMAGVAASLALSRMLSSFLYGVSALDPVIFGAVIAVLIMIAVAGSYVPAMRATRIEPTEALRAE
jgi:putative ABC transport system permease protein